jgi:hypothetical protein
VKPAWFQVQFAIAAQKKHSEFMIRILIPAIVNLDIMMMPLLSAKNVIIPVKNVKHINFSAFNALKIKIDF